MKTLTRMLTGIMFTSLFLMACNKDEDKKTTKKNHFKVGTTEYVIAAGSLENYGMDSDTTDDWEFNGYNIDLAFFSSGLKLERTESGYLSVNGQGQILYFELITSSGAGLENGEYTHDGSEGPFHPGTFDYSDYSLVWNTNNQDNSWIEIASGKITVRKDGSGYEITIDCTDVNGNNVTGYYKGALQYFDYTSNKKSVTEDYKNRFRFSL